VQQTLDSIAPFRHAADWDNVGLLAGRPDWPVRRGLIALDLTDAVAEEALRRRTEVLVLYHPPIFREIRAITPETPGPTRLLPDLLAARIALFALHTALDHAEGGTNDCLLDLFAPTRRWPLEPLVEDGRQLKLVVFVPAAEVESLRQALSAAGAGVIGNYSECSFELSGHGTFCGNEAARPVVGRKQRLERVDEIRLEMIVPAERLAAVVRALYAHHSYEEPAFDVYRLRTMPARARVGGGRVGELARPLSGARLLGRLRGHVDLSAALVVGNLKQRFQSVAVAAGAYNVRAFRDPASLHLTGEFKHHHALDLLRRGITAVALGHAQSERPALVRLRDRLRDLLPGLDLSLARSDRSPFTPLELG